MTALTIATTMLTSTVALYGGVVLLLRYLSKEKKQ